MSIIEIILIGIGLSMDAAAVSMTNGMCYREIRWKHSIFIALSFGVFQAGMPLLGYFAGSFFANQISAFDHWIALALLAVIGGKMIYDGFHHDSSCSLKPFSFGMLMMQSIATSIDALAIGVSFAASGVNIYLAILAIGSITFCISLISVRLGKKIGDKLNAKAEIFGGSILVLIGVKIFIEHMFFS